MVDKFTYTFHYKWSYQTDATFKIPVKNDGILTTFLIWLLYNFTDYVYVGIESNLEK